MSITKKEREEVEIFVCKFFDHIDKTGLNTDYAKKMFAKMSDAEFERWAHSDFPIQLQLREFTTDFQFSDYFDTAKFLGISLLEPVALPYLYENSAGKPLISQPALIIYLPTKRVQQMHTIKNHVSIDTSKIDNWTGRVTKESKSAQMSDREFKGLKVLGMDDTIEEFLTIRADCLNARTQADSIMLSTGTLSQKDYSVSRDDSIAKNTISAYMLSAHLATNLVNFEGYTPYTLRQRNKKIERDVS